MFEIRKEMIIILIRFVAVVLALLLFLSLNVNAVQSFQEIKDSAHGIAQKARENGIPEDHIIIQNAKIIWDEAHEKMNEKILEEKIKHILYYSEKDVNFLAKTAFCEGRGLYSKTQLACIMWTILNRYDAGQGTIQNIVISPNQFSYYKSASTISDYGYDLKELARDVLKRWNDEKNGLPSNGRVLPKEYIYFHGNGKENKFRKQYKHNGQYWNYSLPSPYES